MKRIGSFLLACAMIWALIPAKSFAASLDYSLAIPAQYSEVRAFSCGLAAVRKGTKWGYINERGDDAIPFQYDVACSFAENRAVVGIKKSIKLSGANLTIIEFGCIDMNNAYRPFVLHDTVPNDYPNFYVEIFNAEGEVLEHSDIFYTGGYVTISDEAGITRCFRPDGSELVIKSDSLDIFPIYKPTEGVVIATEQDSAGLNLFVDESGNLISALNNLAIDYARPFNGGLVPVGKWIETGTIEGFPVGEGRWGFADKSGKLVIGYEYEDFYVKGYDSEYSIFNDGGLASVKKLGAGWGAIDRAGNMKIPFIYDTLLPFSEGTAAFLENGKWGFINTEGKIIIPARYDEVSGFSHGIAAVLNGKKAYIIGKNGEIIPGFQNLAPSSYFEQDGENADGTPHYIIHTPTRLVAIAENGKYGFGKITFTPDLPKIPNVSDWAIDEVSQAIEQGLVPISLQNSYYSNITREDFATLIVRTIESTKNRDINTILKEYTGKTLYEQIAQYPFYDTNNADIIAARALGIINGVSENSYAPNLSISRQDAASLLMRTAKFLNIAKAGEVSTPIFKDSAEIASYAKSAVDFAVAHQIMNGTGKNKFSPRAEYTRQQAYITVNRLFNSK